jgi:hypothetical protein
MDDRLTALFRARSEKGATMDRIGMRNTVGLSDADRVKLDVEYEAARQAYYDADKRYFDAVTKAAQAERNAKTDSEQWMTYRPGRVRNSQAESKGG